MQVVCEATQSSNLKIQVAALQNLVKILSLYYDHMEYYMGPALFAVRDEKTTQKTSLLKHFVCSFVLDHDGRDAIES